MIFGSPRAEVYEEVVLKDRAPNFEAAAYGGSGWLQRTATHADEIGGLWADCGIINEWAPLRAVLLHRPGAELVSSGDPDAVLMLDRIDLSRAQSQHDGMVEAFGMAGATVHVLDPAGPATPNQMFLADLLFMTPEGAILSRPASVVRAGEERQVARRLAALGIPILRSLRGQATFEGADGAWIDSRTVMIGHGHRTNREAIAQITSILGEMAVEVIPVDMAVGTMHLMGMLRIVDRDLAVAWPKRTPLSAVTALRDRGFEVVFLPDEMEASQGRALNFVTLGPRKILMVAGNPVTQAFYEDHGIECIATPADELAKAAGAVGCLTGVLWRDHR